jgi:hypothetical protein
LQSIKLTQDDVAVVEELRVLSDLSYEAMSKFFVAFASLVLGNYSEGKKTHFPLLGDFTIKFIKDEISSTGKTAILNVSFSPDLFLRRIVGQFEDSRLTGDFSNSDLVKLLLAQTQGKLSQTLEMNLDDE